MVATLVILRANRIRKFNLLTKESLYNDYSAIEFEHLTAEIFRQLGFEADVTPASGDKGLDVILNGKQGKFGVQCKQYNKNIGPDLIREFVGALEGARIIQGIFVTTSQYTNSAKETAKNSRLKILLVDGEKLGEMRNKAEKRINTELIPQHWWSVMTKWQKRFLFIMFYVCITVVAWAVIYMIITKSSI